MFCFFFFLLPETTDVCKSYDCFENVACPPDSSLDEDYIYDDLIDEHSSERQIPPRFQKSMDNIFSKCCEVDKICKCNPCNKLPSCANSTHIPIRTRIAAEAPGDCCDTYECQPIPKCSEEPTAVWRTECKDCKCMSGQQFCSVVKNCDIQAQEQPAGCLSSELNKIFEHGDEWKEGDDCTDCQCSHGERKCIQTDCRVPECENPVKVPGQCCKVCPETSVTEKVATEEPAGCSTILGRIFSHGEEWKEGDCTDCRCENGDVKCESSFCKPLNCEVSVKIPGQCCRVCADTTTTVAPTITDDDSEESPVISYDNILYIYGFGLLLIITGTVICFFCCRRHHHGNFVVAVNWLFCCCRHPHPDVKFVATTNKYSTIQQSESTVTTAPSTPTMR